MKKLISLFILIIALALALAWHGLTGAQDPLPPCAGYPAPAPYPYPAPCRNAEPPPPGFCLTWITRGPYKAGDSPLYFYPPGGELICRVFLVEFDGKSFDFPEDGCFFDRCVTGLRTALWTRVEFPVDVEQVTVYTMRRPATFLPAVTK